MDVAELIEAKNFLEQGLGCSCEDAKDGCMSDAYELISKFIEQYG